MNDRTRKPILTSLICALAALLDFQMPIRAAIQNPGFELGLSGWLHDGNTYPVGSPSNPVGVDGYSVANLGTFNQVGSYILQNVSIFSGGRYRLNYFLGANGGNSVGRIATVRLLVSGSQGSILANAVNSVQSQGPLQGGVGFQPFYVDFTVPLEGAIVSIRFDDISPGNGFSVDPMIDAVTLEALFPPASPFVISQPISQTVSEGRDVQFVVSAGGGIPLLYQWYRNSEPIIGATNPTLFLSKVLPAQSGLYWVSIQNASGLVTSQKVNLTVLPAGSLITNGNFENDLSGWDHDPSAIVSWGGTSQKVINLGAFDQPGSFISQAFRVDPCGDYSIALAVAANGANLPGRLAGVEITVVTQSGLVLLSNIVNTVSSSFGLSFVNYQFSFAGPALSQQAVLRLRDVSPNFGIGVDAVVDDVHVLRGPSQGLETRTLPSASVSNDGPGASAVLSVPIRYQEIYSAAEFPQRPILISEIHFRPDSRLSVGPFSGFLSYIEVTLSSSPRGIGQLSTRFDDNLGSDSTLTYASSWSFSTAFEATPLGTRKFDIVIPLQRPFRYDPSRGNLLVEIKNFSNLSTRFHVDSSVTSSGVSRIYSDGSPTASFASAADGNPDVLEFGYCYETSLLPSILVQPVDQNLKAGDVGTFRVQATGEFPLRLQWFRNSVPLLGQTNSMLVVEKVSTADVGTYFVSVANTWGSVTSSFAALRLQTPQVLVDIPNATVLSGSDASVQVDIVATGREAGFGFSVKFNPTLLSYQGFRLPTSGNGISATLNTNSAQDGKLGFALVLPAGHTLAGGRQSLIELVFRVASVAQSVESILEFGDDPVAKEVVDAQANPIPASFVGGTVAVRIGGLEGDVSPGDGDGALTIGDWVTIGRLVAGLEKPHDDLHFRKADCAPKATLGDGALTIKDWVQSGRFAANLDSPKPVGGPGMGSSLASAATPPPSLASGGAVVSIPSLTLANNGIISIPVTLSTGDLESALGFSLRFDPNVLRLIDVRLGADVQKAFLNVNDLNASAGSVGVAMALPQSAEVTGSDLKLLELRFEITSDKIYETQLSFTDSPIRRELVTGEAEETATAYVGGVIRFAAPVSLVAKLLADGVMEISWEVTSIPLTLKSSSGVGDSSWVPVIPAPQQIDGRMVLTIPVSPGVRFYMLSN